MKSLIIFAILMLGNTALAQNYYYWPNSPVYATPVVPVTSVAIVPVIQPVVVQEVRLLPVVENKIVYQQGLWAVPLCPGYQPVYEPCCLRKLFVW